MARTHASTAATCIASLRVTFLPVRLPNHSDHASLSATLMKRSTALDFANRFVNRSANENLDLKFIEKLAERKPHRIVFRDTGFKDDTVKTNAEMTLKKHGVEDVKVL